MDAGKRDFSEKLDTLRDEYITKKEQKKKDEKEILFQFDKIVKRISKAQEVNPTLFFSKQNQKALLDTVLYSGTRIGFKTLTKWRTGLIKEPLTLLLKSFGVT